MYLLHIGNKNYSSWSLRPWLIMKELEIPFKEIMHPFGLQDNWNSYVQLNPSGLVPCLSTEQNEIIWDSLGIVEFLAEKHNNVWPRSSEARNWARCATAEMHSGFPELRNVCSMNCGLKVKLKYVSSTLRKDITRIDKLWQSGLNQFGGPFLAGNLFSAVDAFFSPVVFRFQTYGIQLSEESQEYMQQLLSIKSMLLWYEEALNESYRDEVHESKVNTYGKITSDLRKA